MIVFTMSEMSDLRRMWADGETIKAMAARVGVGASLMCRRIQQDRESFPHRRAARGTPLLVREAHPLVQQIIVAAHDRGMSMDDICRRSGVGRHTILAWRRGKAPEAPMLAFVAEAAGLRLTLVPAEAA